MRAVIFDIDGTLADCEHRRRHITGETKDWKSFNGDMHLDTPKPDIVEMCRVFFTAGYKIVLCSGREAVFRDVTEAWLNKHYVPYHALYMRPAEDYRDDQIIKLELLAEIVAAGFEPFMAIDDRDRVVAAWRSAGITCLQAAPGDF